MTYTVSLTMEKLKIFPRGERNFSDNDFEEIVQEFLGHIEEYMVRDDSGWLTIKCDCLTITIKPD